ncbi:hypothetical protein PIB30_074171 [Stylosanthes scabra]|uniref:Uncharacterized protein n=1 Tax=Stylosanthes scabra TaxID=79078 RepID=A0ABU6ZN77_9FABA|nr:hypothetical protein [Stylosanthes scabra]
MRLWARISRIGSKQVAVENENSYSVEQEVNENVVAMEPDEEIRNKPMGEVLNLLQDVRQQQGNKGIIITETKCKEGRQQKTGEEERQNKGEWPKMEWRGKEEMEQNKEGQTGKRKELLRYAENEGRPTIKKFKAKPKIEYFVEMPDDYEDSVEVNQVGERKMEDQQ